MRYFNLISFFFLILFASNVFSANIAYNNNNFTWYPTIQDAVNAANPGDRIDVNAGTYNENVTINKSLSLNGNSYTNTIIDGSLTGNPILITASDVNITNFGVTNCLADSDNAGIRAKALSGNISNIRISDINAFSNSCAGIHVTASNSTIENSFTSDNIWGIRIDFKSGYLVKNCVSKDNNRMDTEPDPDVYGQGLRAVSVTDSNIIDSNFFNNSREGILITNESGDSNNILLSNINSYSNGLMTNEESIGITNSNYLTILDSNISANRGIGIYAIGSTNNFFSNNYLSNNLRNIQVQDYNNSIISLNTFNASTAGDSLYLDRSYRNIIQSNIFSNTANTYFGLNFTGSGARGTSDNNILDNNFVSGYGGIKIDVSANNNLFKGNRLSGMTYGVRIFNGTNNTLRTNHIYSNNYGIRVGSIGNFVYDNNFSSNNNHTYTNAALVTWTVNRLNETNILGGFPLGGNYWSGYAGTDADLDGFGDTNYVTAGSGGNDYLPLVSAVDSVAPYFTTIPPNENLELGSNLLVKFSAEDYGYGVAGFDVNDSINFDINSDGYLTNLLDLNVGSYDLNVSVFDTSTNTTHTTFSIQVNDTTPPIIELVSPENLFESTELDHNFIFNVSDYGERVDCNLFIDGTIVPKENPITKDTNISIQKSGLTVGDHNWFVYCVDSSDNNTYSEDRNFFIVQANNENNINSGSGSFNYITELSKNNSTLQLNIRMRSKTTLTHDFKKTITGLKSITLKTKNYFYGKINVVELEQIPNDCNIPEGYLIFSLIDINATKENVFEKVELDFNIPQKWVSDNKIQSILGIKCLPYFEDLNIKKNNELYKFTSDGFSTWVILGKQTKENTENSNTESLIDKPITEDNIDANSLNNTNQFDENNTNQNTNSFNSQQNTKEPFTKNQTGLVLFIIVAFIVLVYFLKSKKIKLT